MLKKLSWVVAQATQPRLCVTSRGQNPVLALEQGPALSLVQMGWIDPGVCPGREGPTQGTPHMPLCVPSLKPFCKLVRVFS